MKINSDCSRYKSPDLEIHGRCFPAVLFDLILNALPFIQRPAEVARACSVLQFHAINTFVPISGRGIGGAIKTGRPLSNKPASSVLIRGPFGSRPGLPKTIASKTRPWLPTKRSPSGALSNQPLDSAF